MDDWWYTVRYYLEDGYRISIWSRIEFEASGQPWDVEYADTLTEAHCRGSDYCLIMLMMERS